jgi:hypothetical protein
MSIRLPANTSRNRFVFDLLSSSFDCPFSQSAASVLVVVFRRCSIDCTNGVALPSSGLFVLSRMVGTTFVGVVRGRRRRRFFDFFFACTLPLLPVVLGVALAEKQ